MKFQSHHRILFLQGLLGKALIVLCFVSSAYASHPFTDRDFVRISELGNVEVQRSEITYKQYNALSGSLPNEHQQPWDAKNCILFSFIKSQGFGDNHPAACTSFEDAEAYIGVLNNKDSNYSYRLPTTNELETLVKMTLDALKIDGRVNTEEIEKYAWVAAAAEDHAHEVCTKQSAFEVCDILGNLSEWMRPDPDSTPADGGGSWLLFEAHGLFFSKNKPSLRSADVGFRLVRTPK